LIFFVSQRFAEVFRRDTRTIFNKKTTKLFNLKLKSFVVFVISTEGRNHTSISTKIGNLLCGVSSVISPFGRNDKLYVFLIIFLIKPLTVYLKTPDEHFRLHQFWSDLFPAKYSRVPDSTVFLLLHSFL